MRFYIKTYGCQMNQRDSESLAGNLIAAGHVMSGSENDADVLIFNTCSVREQAERKAIGKVGYMKKLKKENPALIIGIIGCMAQNRGDELFELLPHLDFVLGTGQLHKLPEVVETLSKERSGISLLANDDNAVLGAMKSHLPGAVFDSIAITRGCNRFCSYCIVPYVRGREVSRSENDILEEARQMTENGTREILLLGQNVAAYGLGGDIRPPAEGHSPFADLMEKLCKIESLRRLRFTSPYVSYFNDRLIECIAANPKICRNIHLPLQSGSDTILRAMNRQYSSAQYLEVVGKLRQVMPGITFSTDVIVGFPGETEADFRMTRDLLNQVGFDHSFIFKYSLRSGTKAAEMPNQLPQEVKEERNALLLQDLEERVKAKLQTLVGSEQEVLVEGESARNSARYSGKTSEARTVVFEPVDGLKAGDMVSVRIERAGGVSLYGKITEKF